MLQMLYILFRARQGGPDGTENAGRHGARPSRHSAGQFFSVLFFFHSLTGTCNEIPDVVVAIFFSTGSIIPT